MRPFVTLSATYFAVAALLFAPLPTLQAAQRDSAQRASAPWDAAVSRPIVNREPPRLAWSLQDSVELLVTGNSRFATRTRGRDSAATVLAGLGLDWPTAPARSGAFLVGHGEVAWLASARLREVADTVDALILAQIDSTGRAASLTVLFPDERHVARRVPRDDGIVRTSLAEQRNLAAVSALHGERAAGVRMVANGNRVFVIMPAPDGSADPSAAWTLVAYSFDARGGVRALTTAHPVRPDFRSAVR